MLFEYVCSLSTYVIGVCMLLEYVCSCTYVIRVCVLLEYVCYLSMYVI